MWVQVSYMSTTPEAVDAMLAACREGPRLARVEKVEIVGEVEPAFGPFSIRSGR